MVKSTSGRVKKLRFKGVIELLTREYIIEKIKSLPDESLEEVADFIEFLETKGKEQPELAEYGMGDYLTQLLTYEDMLAAGKIRWR